MQNNKSNSSNQTEVVTADDETMAQATLIVKSVALPMTMQAAVDLGLLEIISGHQLTAAEVVEKLPTKNIPQAVEMVERILGLLAAFSVLNCSIEVAGESTRRVYGLTPVGRYFVKDEDGLSMGPLLSLINDRVFLQSWYKVKDAVLEGGVAFDKAHGMNSFEYPAVDPRFNEVFNLAMFNQSSIIMKKIVDSYKGFENVNHLLDVGGGLGHILKIILSKYPNIKGINFDLHHVIKDGLSYPGLEHIGGDMFENVPSAENIFMKWILHDWSDEHCLKLLKNCHKAIPENGKVIVVEAVVSEEPKTTTVAQEVRTMDLIMLSQNPGGKERTEKEFLTLAKTAGFAGINFKSYVCNLWVMEFYK